MLDSQTERSFLHDVVNLLTAAMGRSRILSRKAQALPEGKEKTKVIEDLQKLNTSLDQLNEIISHRRKGIHDQDAQ